MLNHLFLQYDYKNEPVQKQNDKIKEKNLHKSTYKIKRDKKYIKHRKSARFVSKIINS